MSLLDLYRNLSNLSPEKRAEWAHQLAKTGLSEPSAATIVPRPDPAAPVAVSLMQQRLWLLEQLTPGNPFYNLPLLCFELAGTLDLPALAGVLDALERRHESLRTVFLEVDGEPCQRALPAPMRELQHIDLSALPDGVREEWVERLARAEARRLFDLARGPLWRTTLFHLAPGRYLLIIALHHIIADAWSIGVLYREFSELYTALCEGRPSPLAPLPIQYADFALWQRGELQGERLKGEIAFWRELLAGAPELIPLPTDRPHPAEPSYRGQRLSAVLPPELPAAVQRFGQEAGASLYMVLLTAYMGILHRYTYQEDLVVASPVASRNQLETEGLIGFFVNTIVHRVRCTRELSFRQLLGRVREVVLDVYEHPGLPFDKIVEALAPRRDPRYNPIYQTALSLQNTPTPDLELAGLKVHPRGVDSKTCHTDLLFFAGMEQGRLGAVEVEFATDLFDTATVDRLMHHYLALLGAGVTDADRPLDSLAILSEAERRQLEVEWGGNRWESRVWPEGEGSRALLHRLVAARAAATPRATAVVCEGDSLTYAELDRRANQLARRLRDLGVGPEVRVGLALERSLDLVVALLGVLKAGGVYVPLDPDQPAERLELLLADVGAAVLVTQEPLVPGLPAASAALPRVLLDAERAALAALPGEAPGDGGVDPDNAAYIIYTSGSTGRPKGVVITHGQVCRLFPAMATEIPTGPDDAFSFFHSYAFDYSVWEIFGALVSGARVVVVPHAVARSPEAFAELLAAERVTVLCQTPAAFRHLVPILARMGGMDGGRLALRFLFVGGEAFTPAIFAPWFEVDNGREGEGRTRAINIYGITETTVFITMRPIGRAELGTARSGIGWPIPDLSTHVVDPGLVTAPLGVPGEICAGGAGVCRGYLDRPELTAVRFPPDPFSSLPGARLYRTGDLGRRLPDGDLEFLGRIDHQVKVRGIRIELGEIEAALGRHEGVEECVVVLVEIEPGDQRLVAYFAPAEGAHAEPAELRAFLAQSLPDAMVPALYVELPRLPQSATGKLDRRALPAPEGARTGSGQGYTAPRNATEELLAEVFGDLLQVDRVGIFDNFFELGGHSLLATRLAVRVRERLALEVSAQIVFYTPTIALMAAELDRQKAQGAPADAPALTAIPRRGRSAGRVAGA